MGKERRQAARYSRRLEVRFWRHGRPQALSGFTTNISVTGLFLGTTQALDVGEKVRLEVIDRESGFLVESEVCRVHRVAIALRHVDQPGAGLRLLLPEELVARMVPALRGRGATEAPARRGEAASPHASSAVRVEAPRRAASTTSSPRRAPSAPSSDRIEIPAPAIGSGEKVVPVEFTDRSTFLSVYHRDFAQGGLFVSTDVPAAVDDIVTLEIKPPIDWPDPLRFRARVVQRFDPRAAVGAGRNVLAGMAVRFLDAAAVRDRLQPLLAELRRSAG